MLSVLCMVCLFGTCLADDNNENWVQYYYNGNNDYYFVDTNSIKTTLYNGRKYLDVKTKRKEEGEEFYIYFARTVSKTNAEWHEVLDIGNSRGVNLEYFNKYADPKKGSNDISKVENGWNIAADRDEHLLEWVTSNYPSLIDEIMAYNHYNSLRSPLGETECVIKRNTTGVGGAYMIQSEDGLMGLTFDYKPESNMFMMYNLNEPTPYSSMKFEGWNKFKRNSTDMYDSFNGEYKRFNKDNTFKKSENDATQIFGWETNALLTFLRTKAWKYI